MVNRQNNFDLIRLFAACQVMVLHTAHHLGLENKSDLPSQLFMFLSFIPGVPIFFGLSGFLITESFVRKPELVPYIRNRALRIFPGLWGCLLITVLILAVFGYVNAQTLGLPAFWIWLATQLSFFQFYTPSFLRAFGAGSPNGSLWTIVVELQFYVLVPLLWVLSGKTQKRFWNLFTAFAIVGLILAGYVAQIGEGLMQKAIQVTLIPYLPFFWMGATLSVFKDSFLPLLKDKALYWLLGYGVFAYYFGYITEAYEISYFPTVFSRLGMAALLCTAFSCAYTAQHLADKLLKGYDLSYGVYVYHAPFIGVVLAAGWQKGYPMFWAVIGATMLFAWLSWKFIERPALAKKKSY